MPKIKLQISAEPGCQIILIDSYLKRLGKDISYLEHEVHPGIYVARFRAGTVSFDKYFTVTGEVQEMSLRGESLPFSSAVPLSNTKYENRGQLSVWCDTIRQEPHSIGNGAQLFLMARSVVKNQNTSISWPKIPWRGLSLYDSAGVKVIDADSIGNRDYENNCYSIFAAMNPGNYRLRVDHPVYGRRELAIILCEGFQHQIFLRDRNLGLSGPESGGEESSCNIDLGATSQFQFRIKQLPPPDSLEYRFAELVRIGLSRGWRTVRPADLEAMINAGVPNPMVAIAAIYQLRKRSNIDTGIVKKAVKTLSVLLPDHPDIRALVLSVLENNKQGKAIKEFQFDFPPLFRASWAIIQQETILRNATILKGSYAEQISTATLRSSPWLLWRETHVSPTSEKLRELARFTVFEMLDAIFANEAVSKLGILEKSGLEQADRMLRTDYDRYESAVIEFLPKIRKILNNKEDGAIAASLWLQTLVKAKGISGVYNSARNTLLQTFAKK